LARKVLKIDTVVVLQVMLLTQETCYVMYKQTKQWFPLILRMKASWQKYWYET